MAEEACNKRHMKLNWSIIIIIIILIIIPLLLIAICQAQPQWDHVVYLDQNYQLQWAVKDSEITFEVKVKAHGYIGLGFLQSKSIYGADVFIGWIENGRTFYHDCHINSVTGQPVIDSSQNYVLLNSEENDTHTVLRFCRKLDTCDEKFDVPITNDTMNIIYLYASEKPRENQIERNRLPISVIDVYDKKSLLLLQRSKQFRLSPDTEAQTIEITNNNIKIPIEPSIMLKWCHFYQLKNMTKNYIIRYEPVFSSPDSQKYITSMKLYECRPTAFNLELEHDRECDEGLRHARKCYTIVATWSRGSEGFTYPKDIGYAIDSNSTKNLLLEVHYQPTRKNQLFDSSGFRIYYTRNYRKFDAGILEVGIMPNFLHIIPPGFKKVISVGHCISNCTEKFPSEGINIFGVNMQTKSLGRKIKVALVRNGEELTPIAQDSNIDADYIENRIFDETKKMLPGDHVIVECTYNTYRREIFTVGGYSIDDEICSAILMYYPRQDHLVSCRSQTNISSMLRALGIEMLTKSDNKTVIKRPERYAGRTLEQHLQLYDWKNEYDYFDRIVKMSPFDEVCDGAVSSRRESGYSTNIVKKYTKLLSSCIYQDVKPTSIHKFEPTIQPNNDIENTIIGSIQEIDFMNNSYTDLSNSENRCINSSLIIILSIVLENFFQSYLTNVLRI